MYTIVVDIYTIDICTQCSYHRMCSSWATCLHLRDSITWCVYRRQVCHIIKDMYLCVRLSSSTCMHVCLPACQSATNARGNPCSNTIPTATADGNGLIPWRSIRV